MKQLIVIMLFFSSILVLNICCDPENVIETDTSTTQVESSSDYVWNDSSVITITLKGTSINTSSSAVTISGTTATITKSGNYSISGTLSNGKIIVSAEDQLVKIKLNNVTITNSSTCPLFIEEAAKTIIFLADGTTNTLKDASSYSNSDDANACLYSKDYLAITGSGKLNVTGNYLDGIASADQLIINSGTLTVNAVDDAIRGKDYLKINNGTINATSTSGHALKSSNDESTSLGYVRVDGGTITLASSSGKGVKAINKYMQFGGTVTITTAYEGIESANILMYGGTLSITATNDGINSTTNTVTGGTESNDGSAVVVTGGMLISNTTAGDAIDANGNFTLSGGIVIANGPSSREGDAIDINGSCTINGGTMVATGKSLSIGGMNRTSISASQPFIKLSSNISSSTLVNLKINGTDVITFKPKYAGSICILSCPSMTKGASYSLYTGGSYSTNANAGGYYSGGTYTAGSSIKSGTLSASNYENDISF